MNVVGISELSLVRDFAGLFLKQSLLFKCKLFTQRQKLAVSIMIVGSCNADYFLMVFRMLRFERSFLNVHTTDFFSLVTGMLAVAIGLFKKSFSVMLPFIASGFKSIKEIYFFSNFVFQTQTFYA